MYDIYLPKYQWLKLRNYKIYKSLENIILLLKYYKCRFTFSLRNTIFVILDFEQRNE